tara:strand:+ start:503 stop:2161 length:1659 start_codon:yes stop_codon:yes gene_type:complete
LKWIKNIGILFLGAVLLASSFPPYDFLPGAMIGLVPLFLIEDRISSNNEYKMRSVFMTSFLFFAGFNFLTIWWVKNASWLGVGASVLVNSLFFALLIVLYSAVKRRLSFKAALIAFPSFFIGWEYIEFQDWDLSWPWLTLGHAFGNWPKLIQWFSYSGVLGGSLWLIVINIYVFLILKSWREKEESFTRFKKGLQLGAVITIPVVISLFQYYTYDEKGFEQDVVVLQPNLEPYSDSFMDSQGNNIRKYSDEEKWKYARDFVQMAEEVMDNEVDWLLMHETALPQAETNRSIFFSKSIGFLKDWQKEKYPNTSILTGLAYREFKGRVNKFDEVPATYQRTKDGYYFEYYNSSVLINGKSDTLPQYHKSRLVVGVERIPSYFVYFQKYLFDFNSNPNASIYNPNNAIQPEREVFKGICDSSIVAPVICYESVFGEYLTEYINKGANFIGIITNDSWWGDTPGHKQHWSFARLRAIESRRSVARSANTGISGFINQRGDELQKSKYLIPACLRQKIKCNNEITFYVKYGDVIGKLALGLAIMILLNLIVKKIINN